MILLIPLFIERGAWEGGRGGNNKSETIGKNK
jgi:hypothetical protein